MTASERRMVMALCVQKTYEEIVEMLAKDDANQFNMESLRRMFARGGLLVTSDRKTWDEVQPQGFDNFSILPPGVTEIPDDVDVDDHEGHPEKEPDDDADSHATDGEYYSEDDAVAKDNRLYDFGDATKAMIGALSPKERSTLMEPFTPELVCPIFDKKRVGRYIHSPLPQW